MLQGIDVSNHNGSVDWSRVVADFAHAKVSEGTGYVDPFFLSNRIGAGQRKIPFGGYHFARPDFHPGTAGAVAEASFFVSKLGKVQPGDLRPALDLEVGSGDLTVWAGAFLSEVEKLTGVRPLLYTYAAFAKAHLSLRTLAGYGLWLADYGANNGSEHPASLPNVEHQYTSVGRVAGVSGNVDRNAAPSLTPLLVPRPRSIIQSTDPHPEPKNQNPFTRKLWPVPVPQWFWTWAEWRKGGQITLRPADAPTVIPAWAWLRLAAL